MEESLRSSGFSESEIEDIRKQNQEQIGAAHPPDDLSQVFELSKRDEEARLTRLREEDEELQKVTPQNPHLIFPIIIFHFFRFSNYPCKKNK